MLPTMNGGYAYNMESSSLGFDPPQQQQQGNQYQQSSQNPHHNPQQYPASTSTYDPTNGGRTIAGAAASEAGQHHSLLMPVNVLNSGPAMTAVYLSTQQQQPSFASFGDPAAALQPQQQQQQQQSQSCNVQQALNSLANFDPLPISVPAPAGNSEQIQQHQRTFSFDELVLMNPSIFSGGIGDPFEPNPVGSSSENHDSSHSMPPSAPAPPPPDPYREAWLQELELKLPSLSLEPMSGVDTVERVQLRMKDVVTKYLPCVDFLVQCQQELRKGIAVATQKRMYGHRYRDAMTPHQFHSMFVDPLPRKFLVRNQDVMEASALQEAVRQLSKLAGDARNAQRQGVEAVKGAFLGGMKDGESHGLRKWLSRNGAALQICTDIECIHQGVQKLDRSTESTSKLAKLLRPIAKETLDRLKKEVPASYQERSTAHPYLPFFHRLEAALRGMSMFDPEDDDVICIDSDDDEIQEVKPPPAPLSFAGAPNSTEKKRKSIHTTNGGSNGVSSKRFSQACRITDKALQFQLPPTKQPPQQQQHFPPDGGADSSSGEEDDDSVIEVVATKPPERNTMAASDTNSDEADWKCMQCSMLNASTSTTCLACGDERDLLQELLNFNSVDDIFNVRTELTAFDSDFGGSNDSSSMYDRKQPSKKKPSRQVAKAVAPSALAIPPNHHEAAAASALNMAGNLDQLATLFEQNQQSSVRPLTLPIRSFWDGERYADALRLFSQILRRPEAPHFVERVNDERLIQTGNPPFSHVIKNPLCFRDIVVALIQDPEDSAMYPQGRDGRLSTRSLSSWNMWNGMDLLQAIDLVLLNSLAYGKHVEEGKSQYRSQTNGLRKILWNGIQQTVVAHVGTDDERRKQCTPTRRSETSGFVVYKIRRDHDR